MEEYIRRKKRQRRRNVIRGGYKVDGKERIDVNNNNVKRRKII